MSVFARGLSDVVVSREHLKREATRARDLANAHNYCFTASGDERCDQGWGEDCRTWSRPLREAEASIRAAIRALDQAELACAQLALEAAKREER